MAQRGWDKVYACDINIYVLILPGSILFDFHFSLLPNFFII